MLVEYLSSRLVLNRIMRSLIRQGPKLSKRFSHRGDYPSSSPAFRSLRGDVPPYLLRLLSKRNFRNRPSTTASFRQTFDIPLTANETADCAFSVTMPRMVNNFEDVLLDAASLRIFNSHLRSHSVNLICDNT